MKNQISFMARIVESDSYGSLYASAIFLGFIFVGILQLLIVETVGVPDDLVSWFLHLTPFWVILGVLLAGCIVLLDKLIAHTSFKVTEGDYHIQEFFVKKIYRGSYYTPDGSDIVGSFCVLATVIAIIVTFIQLCLAFPTVGIPLIICVGVLVGGYMAVVQLGRFIYRLNKRVSAHIEDPDAHKKS
jgi:hypothetical protein